jgi:hypothetical protein
VISLVRFLLLPLLCLPLCGCGIISKALQHHKKDDKDKQPKDIAIGVIEMVNPEQHFVLIRTGMQYKLSPGWKLETRPLNGPKSVLSITPEQKLNFLSADIVEGFPQQGELVVLPPQPGSAAAVPTLPGTPGTPVTGNLVPGNAAPMLPSSVAPTPAAPQAPRTPIRAPTGEVLPPPIP